MSLAEAGTSRRLSAGPPIKLACLSCRASRIRCDGSSPCANCRNKYRECVYKPSRRGGARVRRKARALSVHAAQPQAPVELPPQEAAQQQSNFRSFISPGAGLKHLNDFSQDSDAIFDALFTSATPMAADAHDQFEVECTFPVNPIVRTYKSEKAILDAYYIFIHPFFPILPPPLNTPVDQAVPHFQHNTDYCEDEFEPSTPITLALSAILALIPCGNDFNHGAEESILFRRMYAQNMAECAIESIEIEEELPQSSIEPSKALEETSEDYSRGQFHPDTPLELESIIALNILSVYEYAQRGNLKKMQTRAGQALVAAMALSIHVDLESDSFSEARRRVWWMTAKYICVCQGTIVSNTEPTFSVFTPSFTCQYPELRSDSDAFGLFIQAQQAILAATQFVIELNKVVKSNGDMTRIYARMNDLEAHTGYLCKAAETWNLQATATTPLDAGEAVVSRALRCMARIKLNSARIKIHRYCAFVDVPIFSAKHCDLKSKTENAQAREPRSWPACSCSNMYQPSPTSTADSSSAISDQASSDSGIEMTERPAVASFSSHQSAKICLKSALSIARSFEDLPYPNPFGQTGLRTCHLSPASKIICPRTMPSFACCAMQCAYALLMVDHKTRARYPESEMASPIVKDLLSQLRHGLTSISTTLENYAVAFEALGGMKDQIQRAIEPVSILDGISEG